MPALRKNFILWSNIAIAMVLAVFLVSSVKSFAGDEISGKAIALNGDTLRLTRDDGQGKLDIRLWGIDAPELRQLCETEYGVSIDCGKDAKDVLNSMMSRKVITCLDLKKVNKNEIAALCYAGDKILNGAVVRAGWALANTKESRDYLSLERRAERDSKGIWDYLFKEPWVWRKERSRGKK